MNKTDNYIQRIDNLSESFVNEPLVMKKVNFIKKITEELSNGQLPSVTFENLVFEESDILMIMQNISINNLEKTIQDLEELDSLFSYFRQFLQEKYGFWATITTPFMNKLIEQLPANKYLELMAGNGYISKSLKDNKLISIATDSKDWSSTSETGKVPLTSIEKIKAINALHKYASEVDIIILAWSPDFDEVDYQILQEYRRIEETKPLFLLIGEPYGATNSKKFWNNVNIIDDKRIDLINKEYPKYDIVEDKLFLID